MKKVSFLFTITFLVTSLVAVGESQNNPVWSQPFGEDSREFFEEGQEKMNQEIRDLEDREDQERALEEKEQQAEQGLEMHQEGPKVQEVPDADEQLGLDDNLPFQPPAEDIDVEVED